MPPQPPDQPIALTTWLLIFVIPLAIWILIFLLREKCAVEVYVVWYAFALFFVGFSFLGAYAWKNNIAVRCIFGQYAWVFDWLTDWNAEFWMVLVFLGLVVLPQWLTYFLSGLSGDATPPWLVSQAHDVAMWSLIKTVASLSGIALAGFLWAQGKFDLSRLIEAETFLLVSFALLAYRYVFLRRAKEEFASAVKAVSLASFVLSALESLPSRWPQLSLALQNSREWMILQNRWEWRIFSGLVKYSTRTMLKMQSYRRRLHKYFTQYTETTSSTTPTIFDQANRRATEALTTVIVQVLRDPRVKSEIVDQTSDSAVEALTKALEDPRVTSAMVQATTRVFETLTTGTVQAPEIPRVASAPAKSAELNTQDERSDGAERT